MLVVGIRKANLYGAGWSMGANLLVQYLGKEMSKGLVAEKIFTSMAENGKQADFVLCIGDDKSDKPSKAKYYLDDTLEVILLLENFAEATDSPVISNDDSE
ncbi:probable alpha,alpha-trehalose-phosphate synthase [UDP-forming] 7 [Tanacetum coccineum]